MVQIKIFTGFNLDQLEKEINEFLLTTQLISSSITYANAQFIITVYHQPRIMGS